MHVHTCHNMDVELEANVKGLVLPFQGLNSSCEAWHQVHFLPGSGHHVPGTREL